MIFIEVQMNESEAATRQAISDAYASTWGNAAPSVRFGRIITWKGRMFRELSVLSDPGFVGENMIFHCQKLPEGKARMLLGSFQGAVFVTPPVVGCDLVARVIEGGPNQGEFNVAPFFFSDYDRLD